MRGNPNITPGFGNGSDAEIWTKEKSRLIQFHQIENHIMENEIKGDYLAVVNSCRIYLRLLMELMVEDQTDPETSRKKKVYGTQTKKFKEMKEKLDELENRLRTISRKSTDPSIRSNNQADAEKLTKDIKDYEDELFFINTELGTNYRRRDIYESWKD